MKISGTGFFSQKPLSLVTKNFVFDIARGPLDPPERSLVAP